VAFFGRTAVIRPAPSGTSAAVEARASFDLATPVAPSAPFNDSFHLGGVPDFVR
jgi:hypothetical protein